MIMRPDMFRREMQADKPSPQDAAASPGPDRSGRGRSWRRLGYCLVWLLVIAGVGQLCFVNFRQGAYGRSLLGAAMGGDFHRKRAEGCRMTDVRVRAIAGDDHIAIQFRGFDPANPKDDLAMLTTYFRSVYALYPQQVFAADPAQVINNSPDLAAAAFNPDLRWLEAHGVRKVLLFAREPSGAIGIRVGTVDSPEAQP